MNRFVTGDGPPRTPERAEMLARVDPMLDRPVILFQDIIEILHRAVLAVVGQIACALEHGNWPGIPRLFGPDPQGVKTIVQREFRHWMHSMNGRPPFRSDRGLLLWRDP